MGCRKIAVTVRGDETEIIKSIRDFEQGFNSAREGSGGGFDKNNSPKKSRQTDISKSNPGKS